MKIIYVALCRSVRLSLVTYLSIMFICLPIYLCICLSVCMSVCPSMHAQQDGFFVLGSLHNI